MKPIPLRVRIMDWWGQASKSVGSGPGVPKTHFGQYTTGISTMEDLLQAIQQAESLAKSLEASQRSRELSLVITKLQEARLWEQERQQQK